MAPFSKFIKVTISSLAVTATLAASAYALPKNQSIMGCAKFGIHYKCAVWRGGKCLKRVPTIICLKRERPTMATRKR